MNISDMSQTITTIYIISTLMSIVGFLIALGGYFLSNSTSSENPNGNIRALLWGTGIGCILMIVSIYLSIDGNQKQKAMYSYLLSQDSQLSAIVKTAVEQDCLNSNLDCNIKSTNGQKLIDDYVSNYYKNKAMPYWYDSYDLEINYVNHHRAELQQLLSNRQCDCTKKCVASKGV